jgi:hypothetical protein
MMRFDPASPEERRNAAYVTILQRSPLLGVGHCVCGNEVVGGNLVVVVDDGDSQRVVGCLRCGCV